MITAYHVTRKRKTVQGGAAAAPAHGDGIDDPKFALTPSARSKKENPLAEFFGP